MQEGVKAGLISGVVAVVVAGIGSLTTIYQTQLSAKTAQASADTARTASRIATQASAVIPGAIAAWYTGHKKQANQRDELFNFNEKKYDPRKTVYIGEGRWRFAVPEDGVYYIGAHVVGTYGPQGDTYLTPYFRCDLRNEGPSGEEDLLSQAIAFNPNCAVAGIFPLVKGDKVSVVVGKSGAYGEDVNGEFFAVYIGPSMEPERR